jgi:AraC-type transcriptional regulator N-terminus
MPIGTPSDPTPSQCRELADLITRHTSGDGIHPTAISALEFGRSSAVATSLCRINEPMLAIVVQGKKAALLGEETHRYNAGQYLVISVDLPLSGFVTEATPDRSERFDYRLRIQVPEDSTEAILLRYLMENKNPIYSHKEIALLAFKLQPRTPPRLAPQPRKPNRPRPHHRKLPSQPPQRTTQKKISLKLRDEQVLRLPRIVLIDHLRTIPPPKP